MSKRLQQLHHWLQTECQYHDYKLTPASADASFRRYFRMQQSDQSSLIIMDAPPEKENCAPFIKIAQRLTKMDCHAPNIIKTNLELGFLLLEDLGDRLYLNELNKDTVDRLYGDALSALMTMQTCIETSDLPEYSETLLKQELDLFTDWYLVQQMLYPLSTTEEADLAHIFTQLIENQLEQPSVFVHRDYHSRNLLVCNPPTPGIIDFQDAVKGALTYDLVSLIKDCYIRWPRTKVLEWIEGYYHLAQQSGILNAKISLETFIRWTDLTGVQRHLKAIGIFSRLDIRDQKSDYIKEIPRTAYYIIELAKVYPELTPLIQILRETTKPASLNKKVRSVLLW